MTLLDFHQPFTLKHQEKNMSTENQSDAHQKSRAPYAPPALEEFGSVADLTRVGITNPGDDVLPGGAQGRDGGSVSPGGLS